MRNRIFQTFESVLRGKGWIVAESPPDAWIYHMVHKLLFNWVPKSLLSPACLVVFFTENFYGERIRQILRIRPSEKYLGYSWIFKNLEEFGINDGRVLAVGCGDSLFPCNLVRRGYVTYAVDLLSDSVPSKYPKLHFVQTNICTCPFRSGVFKLITAVSSLEDIEREQALAVKEISRIIEKEGIIFVTMPLSSRGSQGSKMQKLLTSEFNTLKEEYYLWKKGMKSWSRLSKDAFSKLTFNESMVVIATLVLSKKRTRGGN